jgi:hypothetical protein
MNASNFSSTSQTSPVHKHGEEEMYSCVKMGAM